MKHRSSLLLVIAVLLTASFVSRAAVFPSSSELAFCQIEVWVGNGTNHAALVVDWHDGTRIHALAWGYRWNGSATSQDMWNAITSANKGLSGSISNQTVTSIQYSRPTRAGDLLPATGSNEVFHTAYAFDHHTPPPSTGNWSLWTSDNTSGYHRTNMVHHPAPLHQRNLQHGSWDAWSYSSSALPRSPGFPMAALHYPFAQQVVDSDLNVFFLPATFYTDASTTLGRPTVDSEVANTPGSGSGPVNPLSSAWKTTDIISVFSSDYLEIAFDHRVLDHPDNPYGIDVLVFGNSFIYSGGGSPWSNGDPNLSIVGSSLFKDGGRVFGSQDGTNWIEFLDGQTADQFAPTLGRILPIDQVGATNFTGWAGATDPTIPLDPALSEADLQGQSLAWVCSRYRGSAGGTGFDLSGLNLSPDPVTGLKWIQYLRFQPSTNVALNAEIDAVADVSPALPRDQWIRDNFVWSDSPRSEHSEETLLNYALGPGSDTNTWFTLQPTSEGIEGQFEAAITATDVHIGFEINTDLSQTNWIPVTTPARHLQQLDPDHELRAVPLPASAGSATAVRMRISVSD